MDVTHCAVPAEMENASISFGSAGDRTVWFRMARNAPASTMPMTVISLRVTLCCSATNCCSFKSASTSFADASTTEPIPSLARRKAHEENGRRSIVEYE